MKETSHNSTCLMQAIITKSYEYQPTQVLVFIVIAVIIINIIILVIVVIVVVIIIVVNTVIPLCSH